LRRAVNADVFGHVPFLARKIGTDHIPTLPAVERLEQHVAGVIERLLVNRREDYRRRAQETILTAARGFGRDVLRLTGRPIVLRALAAVGDVRIRGVGGAVPVLSTAAVCQIAVGVRALLAPRGSPGRAALLLPAVDPVRPAVVGDDVIHLRRRLVVPTAPRLAAVDGDRRALISGE